MAIHYDKISSLLVHVNVSDRHSSRIPIQKCAILQHFIEINTKMLPVNENAVCSRGTF